MTSALVVPPLVFTRSLVRCLRLPAQLRTRHQSPRLHARARFVAAGVQQPTHNSGKHLRKRGSKKRSRNKCSIPVLSLQYIFPLPAAAAAAAAATANQVQFSENLIAIIEAEVNDNLIPVSF